MESGAMIVGTNQENAAFPSGLCAERVAVLAAKAAHPNEAIETVYIMTGESEREPAAPCGSCRQVLHETELRQTEPFELILLNKTHNALAFTGVQGLLPFSFTLPR
jgi:cytidine deaminase